MATPVHYLSLPGQGDSIFDMGRSDRRRPAAGAAREEDVARQFEALMLQQWLKQARQASAGEGGPFDSDQTRFAQSLGDEQLALQMAQPGVGLAQALLAQIRGQSGAQAVQPGIVDAPLRNSRRGELRSTVGQPEAAQGGVISRRFETLLSSVNRAGSALLSAVSGAPGHIEKFVTKMAPVAQKIAQETGLPAALILSQAALESGWGKREIKHDDGSTSHNLFGIKATASWQGKTADVMTTEYVDGQAQKQVASFRAYDSYHDSFRDYARLLSTAERYQPVREAQTAEQAARRVQQAGYATDPQYAEKLLTIMRYFQVQGASGTMRASTEGVADVQDIQA